jgi:MFS family permease
MKLSTFCFVIVGYVTFLGDCARGILYPILWPLCQHLGGSKLDLGYLVSCFSIGRLVISLPVGWVSDKYGHRYSLLFSSFFLLTGAALWSNAYLFGLPFLYVAQSLLGFGTGRLIRIFIYVSILSKYTNYILVYVL